MKQGSFELLFLGIAFISLQIWWISMTIRNGRTQKVVDTSQQPLAEEKKRLENLFKK